MARGQLTFELAAATCMAVVTPRHAGLAVVRPLTHIVAGIGTHEPVSMMTARAARRRSTRCRAPAILSSHTRAAFGSVALTTFLLWRRRSGGNVGRRSVVTDAAADERPRRAMRPAQVHTDAFSTPSSVALNTIAIVRSPYKERFGCPRQPNVRSGVLGGEALDGTIEFLPGNDSNGMDEISLALSDLDGFEYLWVIAHLHMNQGWSPKVTPPRGPRKKRGVFSTRAPHRPNHIGLSACKIVSVDMQKRIITVRGLDLLDGTPVLDVKPYVPYCDSFPGARAGWLDEIDGAGATEQASMEPDRLSYSPPPPHIQGKS